MIVTKTYPSKSNTIIRNSAANLGLNPLLELQYGNELSRGLIYFDHTKVKKMVEDKIYPDVDKLHHVLKMTNTASIDDARLNCGRLEQSTMENKQRAASFDLVFFFIPYEWDNGKGYEYVQDLYNRFHRALSTGGSNWYKYRDYFKWDNEGVYSTDRLSNEMDLMTSQQGNLSKILFGWQHFDYGNEDIELDVTCVFNKFITGELENYGFGIAFAPSYEDVSTDFTQYVAFFTSHTHSFFEPYIETTYEETIEDDRANFYLDKTNKLYFYASVGSNYVNLDEPPTCAIDDETFEVKQASKGIYYVEIDASSDKYEADTMYYDVWSNIKYNGRNFPDTELSFVPKSKDGYYSFGLPSATSEETDFELSIYGIDDSETIKRGDIRKVNVECKIPYTSGILRSIDGMEYRLYVNEGEKQYDVIGWQKVEKGYNENFFLINTNDLLPSRYHIDIRVSQNFELIYHRDILEFDIINDVTETYK